MSIKQSVTDTLTQVGVAPETSSMVPIIFWSAVLKSFVQYNHIQKVLVTAHNFDSVIQFEIWQVMTLYTCIWEEEV
jgi:hypothetical protein